MLELWSYLCGCALIQDGGPGNKQQMTVERILFGICVENISSLLTLSTVLVPWCRKSCMFNDNIYVMIRKKIERHDNVPDSLSAPSPASDKAEAVPMFALTQGQPGFGTEVSRP